MGDGGTRFDFDELINVAQVRFTASSAAEHVPVEEVRRALEGAVKAIPDSKLKGFKSFRLLVLPD